MFLRHDTSWWELALSIACLVLAIPIGIYTNQLTPNLRVWWTVRSLDSATKRLVALMALMEHVNRAEPFGGDNIACSETTNILPLHPRLFTAPWKVRLVVGV